MKQYGQRISALLMAVLLVGQLGSPVAMAMDESQNLEADIMVDGGQSLIADIMVDQQTFPDDKFRAWILDGTNLNGAGADGILTAEELANIREINVSGMGIQSLKGIEVFTSLEVLNCSDNELTVLDVSNNPKLTRLYCGYNVLQELSLKHNPELVHLNCSFNRLSALDVSSNTKLITLYAENNYLTQLNLKGCTEMTVLYTQSNLLTELDLSTSTKLKFIHAFDNRLESIDVSMLSDLEFLHINHNQLTSLDMSHNLNLVDGGFIASNNDIRMIQLPNLPSLTVYLNKYEEQDPFTGYDRMEWYLDSNYTQKVEGDVQATGQTLYGKRIANDYTIHFSSNYGSGSMASLPAVYDQEVTLPKSVFTRYGHYFTGWNTLVNGTGYDYSDEQIVHNIAGKWQGDRITLYAQWAPIQYNIEFNANGGSGSMQEQTGTYNKQLTLPANTFTLEGMEFAGWSRNPKGPVHYKDGALLQNLSAQAGETVTLYAVWRTPVAELQKPFIERLDQAFKGYSSGNYTGQDWKTIAENYSTAIDQIQGSEEESMMEIYCESGIRAMEQVPTMDEQKEAVVNGWKSAHSAVVGILDAASLDENNGVWAAEQAKAAIEDLTDERLKNYSNLTDNEDLEQIIGEALSNLRPIEEKLLQLQTAAEWLNGLEGMTIRPLDQVTSADLDQYLLRIKEYDTLNEVQMKQISSQVRAQLEARYQLAGQKRSAVAELRTIYEGYDLTTYSTQGQAALLQALEDSLAAVEHAVSGSEVQSAQESGSRAMSQVPTADEEQTVTPDPNPDEGTEGDTGGSTEGNTSGSTGGNTDGGAGGITGGGGIIIGGGGSTGAGSTTEPEEKPEQSNTVTVTDEKTGAVTEITTAVDGKISASVKVPEDVEHVNVTIPCDANDGTVVFLVKEDGSREIVRKASMTDKGLTVRLDGSAMLEIVDNTKSFTDVNTEDWYAGPVQFAASRELFTGIGNDSFAPDASMTRAMLVTVLYRLENSPSVAGESSFDDVSKDSWYTDAVQWAVEQGIAGGVGSGSFAPEASITRESLAVMLYRYAQNQGLVVSQTGVSSVGSFQDAGDVSSWAKEAMEWACTNGIMQGSDQMLRPGADSSRAEVAAMLMRFVALLTKQA